MLIAIYPRVSTQEQFLNGHSIDEQIERMKKYCEAMGWTVFNVYTDAGFSGATTERPGLQRMIKDVKKGKIDKVLVYKLDRLSRSQKDTLELIEDVFLANNTEFVSMSENFDTSTPFGRAMVGILAVFAQLEREQIKERMMMGKVARAKQGKFCGTHIAPIGYNNVNGDLSVNEFEALQVNKCFEEYAAGKSPYAIADELNNAGLYHRYGKWSADNVYKLLHRRTYLGYNLFSGQWYKSTHTPIVSEELFNTVQEILNRKKEEHRLNNRRIGRANSYLGGYLECGCCGAKYFKNSYPDKKGGYYEYYSCCSRVKKKKHMIKDPNCKNKTWNMAKLNELVFAEIRKLALDPNYIDTLKETAVDERPTIIANEIEKLETQINRYMDLYGVGNMPVDVLQAKIKDLNDKKIELEHEIIKIEQENADKLSKQETIQIVNSFSDILANADFDEIREVISSLIDKIVVNGENITIYWKFV